MENAVLFYLSLVIVVLGTAVLTANPYRLRNSVEGIIDTLLPTDVRSDLMELTDAWAGKVKMKGSQITLLSFAGLFGGMLVGVLIFVFFAPLYGILLGGAMALLLFYYPRNKFVKGIPKTVLFTLEREASLLAGFMYRARGVSGLSAQQSFNAFVEQYGDTVTADLIRRAPESVAITKALLSLDFPANEVPSWLEVITTMDGIHELGNPQEVLRQLRGRVQDREEQYMRALAKQKAFKAPVVTVLSLLLPLMSLILIPLLVMAAGALGL